MVDPNSKKLLNYALKNNFPAFLHKSFNFLNPSAQFYYNWHIDLIAEYLRNVEKGNIKRLIINIPPRCLKSVTASIAWSTWLLGQKPERRILTASYSQSISTKFSLDSRFIIESNWYRNLYPKTKISNKQNQKNKFLTTKHGFRLATSVGGSVTGEGGDFLILDDPHNPAHIHSKKRRENVINWFLDTFSTRLNDRKKGAIIIIMQRLHEHDLTGFLLKNQPKEWHFLEIPLISDHERIFSVGNFEHKMKQNEILNDKFFDNKTIQSLVNSVGVANFEAQYLQNPKKASCSIISEDSFYYYEKIPKQFEMIIQSWDTAVKISENSDYSACTCWGVLDNKYYLIEILNQKLEYPSLKSNICNMYNKYLPQKLLIEDKSSGQAIIQDLKNHGIKNIIPCIPIKDKVSRFACIIDLFESGQVLLPKYSADLSFIKNNLLEFPNSKHDDIVDSISQFLNFIKKNNIKNKSPLIRNI